MKQNYLIEWKKDPCDQSNYLDCTEEYVGTLIQHMEKLKYTIIAVYKEIDKNEKLYSR